MVVTTGTEFGECSSVGEMMIREHRPDFVLIGSAKSGTTSLFAELATHPDLFASPIKEPAFFSYSPARPKFHAWERMLRVWERDNPGRVAPPRGEDSRWDDYLEIYRDLFRGAQPGQVRGEASTDYTRWPQFPGVPARMSSIFPDLKLLYIVRHPVDRAYSHFCHPRARDYRQQSVYDPGGTVSRILSKIRDSHSVPGRTDREA
jgi:hypothetical protein